MSHHQQHRHTLLSVPFTDPFNSRRNPFVQEEEEEKEEDSEEEKQNLTLPTSTPELRHSPSSGGGGSSTVSTGSGYESSPIHRTSSPPQLPPRTHLHTSTMQVHNIVSAVNQDENYRHHRATEGDVFSSSTSSDCHYWRPHSWSELTLDFLESITRFLTLTELLHTARASHTWHTLMRTSYSGCCGDGNHNVHGTGPGHRASNLLTREWTSLIPRNDRVRLSSYDNLLRMISSPLLIHITALHLTLIGPPVMKVSSPSMSGSSGPGSSSSSTSNTSSSAPVVHLSHADLHLLKVTLLRLRELECSINCASLPLVHRQLPAVEKLTIILSFHSDGTNNGSSSVLSIVEGWQHASRAMSEICSNNTTLTSLTVILSYSIHRWSPRMDDIPIDFIRPLVQLTPTLTSLTLGAKDINLKWTRAHFTQVFRRLMNLRSLDLGNQWLPEELDWFTQNEPSLQPLRYLTRVRFTLTSLTPEHVTFLSRLNQLTELRPKRIATEDLSWFAHLSELRQVKLACTSHVTIVSLLECVPHCRFLEVLELSHVRMTSEAVTQLLTRLPQLRSLHLTQMDAMHSLTFASTVSHLAHTLEMLDLRDCSISSSSSLHHLRSLSALKEFHLVRSLLAPVHLDQFTLDCFTPSAFGFQKRDWPKLRLFEYVPKEMKR